MIVLFVQFIMNRITNDLIEMEAQTKLMEKELATTAQTTEELEDRTKKIWEEIDRKRLEVKAAQIINSINAEIK